MINIWHRHTNPASEKRAYPLLACVLWAALHFSAGAVFGAEASGPAWVRNAFSLPESIWSVEAVDVNADGKRDLIAMGETKLFALIAPEWKQHLLLDTREPK